MEVPVFARVRPKVKADSAQDLRVEGSRHDVENVCTKLTR
jgi:hypothetical protein